MDERLVSACIRFLRSVSEDETNVNSVIKKTGLYKNLGFEAYKTLKKANLITVIPDPKHMQRRIVRLTDSAKELDKLMKAITDFNKSFADLSNSIKVNFDFDESNKKVLKNKLLARNWRRDDIKYYTTVAEAARFCQEFSMNQFSEALITRYYLLLASFRLNIEAQNILIKVITDALSEQLSIRQKEYKTEDLDWTPSEIISRFHPSLFEWLESGDLYPLNYNNTGEIRNLCRSLIFIMSPPKDYVHDLLEDHRKSEVLSGGDGTDDDLSTLYAEYLELT